MKYSKISFLTSFLMTLAIILMVYFITIYRTDFFTNFSYNKNTFIAVIIIVFIINLVGIEQLFRFYSRRQIKKMSEQFPNNFTIDSDKFGFKELGEKISGINKKNSTEMDMMMEMENYRKEYLGNVSHEMKTPLFSIQGYLETLKDGGIENLNIRDKYLERIGISVERLLNIVTDLDMINRYEAGEISLILTKFDINALVKEVMEILDLQAQKKNATINLQTSQTHIFVTADKQKISQVLINLITNAIYYSNRDNAKITIKTNVLYNKVLVEVIDNGMGIKPEILPRIFERFYRVETSRSRTEGGSGLGLAIVKHILEAHNENITAESVYLEGTKFNFFLTKA